MVEIPTNVLVIRKDEDDEVYRTVREKYDAIVTLIRECNARQQPVLVGTVSIEKSETLAALLQREKIPHNVLNARFHEQEAYIVAQAGRPGAVTIATNMAGRGTDIQLGGNVEMRVALELAGIDDPAARDQREAEIRAEVAKNKEIVLAGRRPLRRRHRAARGRRIDNQLRGRSGRQGDPGGSKFFLSLEDDLMRIFASERLDGILRRFGLKEGEAIIHPWINRALEKAQEKVEARNFDIRKNLLRFDNVMNDQRKVIYEQRREIMQAADATAMVTDMRQEVVAAIVARAIPENSYAEKWNIDGLHEEVLRLFGLDLPVKEWGKEEGIADREIEERIQHGGRRQDGRQGRGLRRRDHADGREEPAAADPGPELEGPSADAGPSAPGHQPARLCPARPAARVPGRGVQPVRADAGRPARERHPGAGPGRAARYPAGGCRGPAARGDAARDAREPLRPRARRAAGAGDGDRRRRGGGGQRGAGVESRLGPHPAQRPVPLRLGQEVQALPRNGGVGPATQRTGSAKAGGESHRRRPLLLPSCRRGRRTPQSGSG